MQWRLRRNFLALAIAILLTLETIVPNVSAAGEALDKNGCKLIGSGFIAVPGTNTCIKIGIDITSLWIGDFSKDYLRIETQRIPSPVALYDAVTNDRLFQPSKGFVDARPSLMVVTPTEAGTLIGYTRLRTASDLTGGDRTLQSSDTLILDKAWFKINGLTIGYHQSFFDFVPGFGFTEGYDSLRTTNLAAYTQALGKIATLTISAEDARPRWRQEGVLAAYAPQRMPDVVSALRVTPEWGGFQFAGAFREIRDSIGVTQLSLPKNDVSYGWAAMVGLEYRMTYGEQHGRILLSGAVANGALDYLGIPPFSTDYIADADGKIRRTYGMSATIAYEHLWTPTFKTVLSASAYRTHSETTNFGWKTDGTLFQVNVEKMLVPNLMVGVEFNYFSDRVKGTFFGEPGDKTSVGFLTGLAYIRRRI